MNTRTPVCRYGIHASSLVLVLLLTFMPPLAQGREQGAGTAPPRIDWQEGPATVDLGQRVAQIQFGKEYIFADAKDTRVLLELLGNPPSQQEVGLIASRDETKNWFIVFEYNPVGYIRDDDKDALNADAILDTIKRSTEEANAVRRQNGFPGINVIGWYERPHYDPLSNNLVWAVLAEEQGTELVNYNVRLLGRQGYMSAVLVTDRATLDLFKPDMDRIIANFSYHPGRRYAEFVPGDRVAQIGLAALIAGGAGAAAVKFGLFKWLAKAWKLVVAAAMALVAGVRKVFKGLLRREESVPYHHRGPRMM